jgi:purine-binding chemotaxis protein CheW
MAELFLIARLGGRRVAFPATSIEAVVGLEGITPTPCAAPHVAGLAALRSRVLTVIDGLAALDLGCAAAAEARDAIVIPCDGHTYALIVEEIEDVIEADAPPVALAAPVGAGWDRVAIGTVEVGSELFLLVDPYLLIAGPAANAA